LPSSNPLGTPFLELPTVDSTNNYAMGMVRAGMAHHGTAVFTTEQTSGKGQRNKTWISQPRQNMALSLVLEPQPIAPDLFLLSMAMAEGTFQFFTKYVSEDVSIKWPNDLYWRDRKAGGILIENVWQANSWNYAVVGIGININQSDFGSLGHKAVSLKQIIGKESEPLQLAKELCTFLDQAFQVSIKNPDEIRRNYNSHLYKLHQKVKLKTGSRLFEATVKEVHAGGQLVVQHGTEERFDVGEVEWIS
jgi:BirA family biotin operon repressor/biotin-[acetyl-CoA-carboxylase] ligase